MARNEFEQEVGQLLKGLFPVAERLDDVAFNREGKRQVKRKPYDFYGATLSGQFWGAEAKRVKLPRFDMRNVKDHQLNALMNLERNNCLGWLFINWRCNKFPGIAEGSTGVAIWIPYCVYDKAASQAKRDGRASVTPVDFPGWWLLRRISGGWEVPPEHPYYGFREERTEWASSLSTTTMSQATHTTKSPIIVSA